MLTPNQYIEATNFQSREQVKLKNNEFRNFCQNITLIHSIQWLTRQKSRFYRNRLHNF